MTLLYHYTDAAGLKGILERKELWATNFRYFNDPGEYRYGSNLFLNALRGRESLIVYNRERTIANLTFDNPSERNYDPYICSFSRQGDLLSQWRGYNRGLGFVIGFDEDRLRSSMEGHSANFVKINYALSEQQQEVENCLQHFYKTWTEAHPGSEPSTQGIEVTAFGLMVSFKHYGFHEEEEVRFVRFEFPEARSIKVRLTAGGFKPYISFPLTKPNTNDIDDGLINKITVGPALHPDQILAVEVLLREHNVSASVEKSSIPYVAT